MAVTLLVRHPVARFDEWQPAFDGDESNRRLHGAFRHRVLRDGNTVTVLLDFPNPESASPFGADPALAEAMAKGGVVGAPDVAVPRRRFARVDRVGIRRPPGSRSQGSRAPARRSR